uniref:Pectate lyase n=1 Tax=Panagrellus redivivus TaxID=6233 RepID=A0A7E5A102_PANRE
MEQCHSPSKKVYVTTVVGVTSIQTIRVRDFESGVRLVMATGQLGRHYSSGCFDRVCDRNPDDVEGAWIDGIPDNDGSVDDSSVVLISVTWKTAVVTTRTWTTFTKTLMGWPPRSQISATL